jgi:hypothetical protein
MVYSLLTTCQCKANAGSAENIELAIFGVVAHIEIMRMCVVGGTVDNSGDKPWWVWKTLALSVDKYNGILAGVLQFTFAP